MMMEIGTLRFGRQERRGNASAMACCVFRIPLLLLLLPGCVPHPVYTPLFGRELRPLANEREDFSRGLIVALYQWEFTPGIDYGGPYPLRARVVTVGDDGVYRAPIEVCEGKSGVFLWFIVHTFQHDPIFYAFLSDGRNGLVAPPKGYSSAFGVFLRCSPPIRPQPVPEAAFHWAPHTADEQMRYLILCGLMRCEMREHEPDHPFIPEADGHRFHEFIRAHPAVFSETTRVLAERLAATSNTPPSVDEYDAWKNQLGALP